MGLEEARLRAHRIIEERLETWPEHLVMSEVKRRMKDMRRLSTFYQLGPHMQKTHEWMQDDDEFAALSEAEQIAAHRETINPDVIEGRPARSAPPEDAYAEAGLLLLQAWLAEDPTRTVKWYKTRSVTKENAPADAYIDDNGQTPASSEAIDFLAAEFKQILSAIPEAREARSTSEINVTAPMKARKSARTLAQNAVRKLQPYFSK